MVILTIHASVGNWIMLRNIPLAEVKAKLSSCVRSAERGKPIVITRHGRPVAALVSAEDLDRIQRLRAAGPEGGLASLAGGWEESGDLAAWLESRSRDRRRSQEPLA